MFASKNKLMTLAAVGALAVGATQAAGASTKPAHRNAGGTQVEVMNRMVEAVKQQRKASRKAEARKQASAATAASSAVKSPETYGVSQSTLDAIAACESGGDPSAVSAGGIYRGLYQFDQATWESVGGTGDPAAASPAEQSMRAAMLYSQSGSSPWPVCG